MMIRLKPLYLLSICALGLAACSPTKVNMVSDVPVPVGFEHTMAGPETAIDQWWLSWQDPQLNQLIANALQNSKDLASTRHKLQEARQMARLAQADMGPIAGLNGNTGLQAGRIKNPLSSETRQVFDYLNSDELGSSSLSGTGFHAGGGIAASWEPDIFGAKGSDADAARHGALARQEQLHGAQMLVASDIVDYYSQMQYYRQKKLLAQHQVQILNQLKRYVQGRFKAGQASAYNIQEVESKIQAAQAQANTYQAQADHAVRQIAVVSGAVPQNFRVQTPSYALGSNLPPLPTGQTPANVLNRRPDVRAKQQQVYIASAQLASAKADLLPRFQLNFLGQGGTVKLSSDVPHMHGVGGILNASMQLPLFTNGRIDANIDAKDENLKSKLNDYDHTVLKALAEVDSSYQAQSALNQQAQDLKNAVDTAQTQAHSAAKLFKHGQQTLDTTLRSRLDANDMQDKALQANLARVQNMINLYKALGGGWQSRTL
ncbi:efflux transporter outer membrane subunit [Brackiella oedipodis]|uniref:efflux transporter outer membrane subunit n=1 Tax=Brackiella oedipodis TaxID=124225 RepID=UPI0006859F60|nr:TolC family protein [Brackiella oedipodis]